MTDVNVSVNMLGTMTVSCTATLKLSNNFVMYCCCFVVAAVSVLFLKVFSLSLSPPPPPSQPVQRKTQRVSVTNRDRVEFEACFNKLGFPVCTLNVKSVYIVL